VSALIRLEGIGKRFGSVEANRSITLDIHEGRIKALLGENGAGKSTLMSILAGRLQADEGAIFVEGRPTRFSSAADAIGAGIGMVYQHFTLVEAMTVAENIFLGHKGGFWSHPASMERTVADLSRTYGLLVDPSARVSSLSMGEKQRVEILKLLFRKSRALIFDEPTAVLTPQEIDQLFAALRRMAEQGKAIVFISHKLDEVLALADDIAILRRGSVVEELPCREVTSKAELARKMVGREVLLEVDRPAVELRQPVLSVESLSGGGLRRVAFRLHQGEILGIVGVAGNGQKPLVETVCGLRPPESGTVRVLGSDWRSFFARSRWDGAISYIPEDRRGLATCLNMSLTENFLLTTRRGFARGPWLSLAAAEQKAEELVERFRVHPPTVHTLARRLSGGNLQKLVLAREFYRRPRLIVAEQPTQGLDIGAMEEVWNILLKARERAGILLVTGDVSEALALSDRIAVMFGGRIMADFPVSDRDSVDRMGAWMAGVQAQPPRAEGPVSFQPENGRP
jgi:simple sugar transport system ATP-binding protein